MKKYQITILFILIGALLLSGCMNTFNPADTDNTLAPGYGKIKIDLAGGKSRTVFPTLIFDNCEYFFKKVGESEQKVNPESDGATFVLATGDWSVRINVYVGDINPANLAATGTAAFKVEEAKNNLITVILTGNEESTKMGSFEYSVEYPEAGNITVSLKRLPDLTAVTGFTGTSGVIELPAGFYLFTAELREGGTHTSGIAEAVHIVPLLKTTYTASLYSEIPSPTTGTMRQWDFGYIAYPERNYQLAVWHLSGVRCSMLKITGQEITIKLNSKPKAGMNFAWVNTSIWDWNEKKIFDDSGNVITGSGAVWNESTKTLTITLATVLANKDAFYECDSDIQIILQYFGAVNINALGINDARFTIMPGISKPAGNMPAWDYGYTATSDRNFDWALWTFRDTACATLKSSDKIKLVLDNPPSSGGLFVWQDLATYGWHATDIPYNIAEGGKFGAASWDPVTKTLTITLNQITDYQAFNAVPNTTGIQLIYWDFRHDNINNVGIKSANHVNDGLVIDFGSTYTKSNGDNSRGWDIKSYQNDLTNKTTKYLVIGLDASKIQPLGGIPGIGIILNSNPSGWKVDDKAFPWYYEVGKSDLNGWVSYDALIKDFKFVYVSNGVIYLEYDLTKHPDYASFDFSGTYLELFLDCYEGWKDGKDALNLVKAFLRQESSL
jgi:hypothetical protein